MVKPLKIVHSIPDLSIGGIERLVSHICRSLARRGHDVKLIAFDRGGELLHEADPATTEIWGIKPGQILKLAKHTKQALRLFKADILHAHPGLGARLGAFSANVPIVSTYHTLHAKRPLLLRRLDGYLAKRTAALTAVSEAVRKQWTDWIPDLTMEVITNGIDLDVYRKIPSHVECRKSLGWEGENVICVARLHKDKGIDVLLHSWALLSTRKGRTLRVVGLGPEEPALRKISTELGILDSVDFLGGQSDIARYWKAATVAVIPSRVAPFEMTVIEAMAAGTPVIVSNAGALSKLGRGASEIFDSENAGQLAKMMEELLNDEPRRTEMTEAGLVRAKEYDLEKTVDRYEELYYRVLK